MKRPAERLGLLAGFLWAALTKDSPPAPAATATGDNEVNAGSYRTAPLTAYRPEACDLAQRIYHTAAERLTSGKAHRHKGSYSFVSGSGATLAKIIIFERGVGRVSHDFPITEDGVYLLLRVSGKTQQPTIGVAPNYSERFAYRRIDEINVDSAVRQIVAAIVGARSVSAP